MDKPLGKTFFLHRQRRHPELPNIPTYLPGQATLASCARRYPVSDKTIQKGVRNYISGEVVQLWRRGPKPAVDDGKIAAWLEAQRKASLSPYKYVHVTRLAVYSSVQQCQVYCVLHRAEVVEEAVKMALEHRVNGHPTKIPSGNKWFRLWKKRHPEYTSRTPQLVESDRADARLTRAEWKRFFFEVVRPVYNEIGFDVSRIYNLDESEFFRQFITNSGAPKVITKRGCNDVYRRRGYGREQITGIACIRADGIGTVPLTLLFKTKKVKGDWFPHACTPVMFLGNGTGWSAASDFQVYLERVFQHYTGCSDTEDVPVVLLVDGSKTHLTAEVLVAAKRLGVFLICFPSHSTEVVQPLDVTIFAPLERKFRTGQDRWVRSHQGRSLTHSRFVELVTGAWGSVAGTTPVKESFRITGLSPLSFDEFMEQAPVPRIRDDVPAPNIAIESPDEGVANASDNNDPHPQMADASSQVCSRAINSAMRDDPTSMKFGGFVTSEEFIRACTAANSTRAAAA